MKAKNFRIFKILSLLYICMFPAICNSQIEVSLRYPSVFQFLPTDLWNVTVTNQNSTSKKVYLKGLVKDNSQNVLLDITSASLTLSPGSNSFNSNNVTTSTISCFNSTLQSILNSTGQFPSGSYVSCITVLDYSSNDELAKECVENTVEVIGPPHLSYPDDQSVIDNAFPVFVWIPPSPLRSDQKVSYQLVIVELNEGQSAEDALSRNDHLYDISDLSQPVYSYPFSALPFNDSTVYAWQITATLGTYEIGKSEAWEFIYKIPKGDTLPKKFLREQDFFALKDKIEGGYYIANGALKFRVNNEFNTGIKSFRLLSSDFKDLTTSNISITQPYNDDRYVIDISNVSGITENNFYLFELITASREKYLIRFKYIEPTN